MARTKETDPLLTLEQVAERLSMTPAEVRQLVGLPICDLGGKRGRSRAPKLRVQESALVAFIATNTISRGAA